MCVETIRLVVRWRLLRRLLFNLKMFKRVGAISLKGLKAREEKDQVLLVLENTMFGEGVIYGIKLRLNNRDVKGEVIINGKIVKTEEICLNNPLIIIPGQKITLRLYTSFKGTGNLKLLLKSEIAPTPYRAELPIVV